MNLIKAQFLCKIKKKREKLKTKWLFCRNEKTLLSGEEKIVEMFVKIEKMCALDFFIKPFLLNK